MSQNFTKPEIITRLKKAAGHLNKVVKMAEEKKDYLVIAQQLQAVEGAIIKAKKNLVNDYINYHLEHSTKVKNTNKIIKNLKQITQYL